MKLLSEIRGYRNNNPGNIRHSSARWNGLSSDQTDTSFCQFTSPEYGIRALCKILMNYQTKHRKMTIRAIIDRYAPPVENDTNAYADHVAAMIGTKPDLGYRITNKILMTDIVSAIITHECGLLPYSREVVERGVEMAGVF